MRRSPIVVPVAILTVLAASGCAPESSQPPPPAAGPESPPGRQPVADTGPLPPPDALTGVLYRLADSNVPGSDKLRLIQDGTASDTRGLDGFAAALRDGGFAPVTVTATDIRGSDSRPGDVLATIAVTGPEKPDEPDGPGEFVFPMAFRLDGDGWQLTRETAEELLTLGDTGAGATAANPPP